MSRTILVVDDEPDVEALFAQMLRREIRAGQIEFRYADSGESALRMIEEVGHNLDLLIFSDVNMPQMTGLELLSILHQKYPELRIYIVTAYGTEDMADEVTRLGGQGLISKPVAFPELKELVLTV
ncbi:MAG: response regulator [Xanthomonadales bacterium]|nr:Regulator of RpoS [Xanthomonadales bacterium]MCC6593751.1 response regulator [Xanthomonadales bacterium]MCE7932480.1 response regulator [Xanthomonadales bacterium PRO6]